MHAWHCSAWTQGSYIGHATLLSVLQSCAHWRLCISKNRDRRLVWGKLNCTARSLIYNTPCYCCEPLNLKQDCCASITLASSPALNLIYSSRQFNPLPPFLRATLKCVFIASSMQHAEGFVLERVCQQRNKTDTILDDYYRVGFEPISCPKKKKISMIKFCQWEQVVKISPNKNFYVSSSL